MTTHVAADGTIRQNRYGDGRQPWDDILDKGWAPSFAAGNVLKYLRRDKHPEHSLESARWYYARLHELMRGQIYPAPLAGHQKAIDRAAALGAAVLDGLNQLLTADEKRRLKEEKS